MYFEEPEKPIFEFDLDNDIKESEIFAKLIAIKIIDITTEEVIKAYNNINRDGNVIVSTKTEYTYLLYEFNCDCSGYDVIEVPLDNCGLLK